jgi:benzylsuccinate CoA-transferase BbsF subunit
VARLSQFETGLQGLGPALLDCVVNSRNVSRDGNRHRWAVPHNVYPCLGDDRWCAIEVTSDAQWAALCRAMGQPELTDSDDFGTFLERRRHETELDRIIAAWTSTQQPDDLVVALQSAGVPAGLVKSPGEVIEDPQLRSRNVFFRLNHPVLGPFEHFGATSTLSRTPATGIRPAPCYGEHNDYVCRELLGLSEEEFLEALLNGVFDLEN